MFPPSFPDGRMDGLFFLLNNIMFNVRRIVGGMKQLLTINQRGILPHTGSGFPSRSRSEWSMCELAQLARRLTDNVNLVGLVPRLVLLAPEN